MLNRIELLGHVGSVETKTTTQGMTVMKMRLATTHPKKVEDGRYEKITTWHNVTVWGRRAEGLSQVVDVGKMLYVEGRMQHSEYEDQNGQKRFWSEVNANNVILCGKREDGPPVWREEPKQPPQMEERPDGPDAWGFYD